MKRVKRIVAFISALAVCVTAVTGAMSVQAAQPVSDDTLYYDVSLESEGAGSIFTDRLDGKYLESDNVNVTAKADEGWYLDQIFAITDTEQSIETEETDTGIYLKMPAASIRVKAIFLPDETDSETESEISTEAATVRETSLLIEESETNGERSEEPETEEPETEVPETETGEAEEKIKSSFTKKFAVGNTGGVLRITDVNGNLIDELREGQERNFEYFVGSDAPAEIRVQAIADDGYIVSAYTTKWYVDGVAYNAPETENNIEKKEYARGHYLASAEFDETFVVSFAVEGQTKKDMNAFRSAPVPRSTGDIDNPAIGDKFTGRARVVYNGDPNRTYDGTGHIVGVTGDFKGEELLMSTCASGSDYAAPLTGQVGTYTIVITKVDVSKGLIEGTIFWENDSNSSGYQNLSGTFKTEIELQGKIRIKKISSDENISSNNSCYSVEGAKFKLTNVATKEVVKERLITNGKGVSQYVELPAGTYKVEEVEAPEGFILSESTINVKVKSGSTITYELENRPVNDPVGLMLKKVDKSTGKDVPVGAGEFKGAEYTIKYYDGQYSKSQLTSIMPKRTWVLVTNVDGEIIFPLADKVSGDDFYLDALTGLRVIPLGTISIQETKAPKGYGLDPELYVQNIKADSKGELISSIQPTNSPEPPIKVDVEINKTSSNKGISDNNRQYTYAGAIYGLYKVSDNSEYARVTLGKDGYGKITGVPYDNYYVQEIKPPKGYAKIDTKYSVTDKMFEGKEIINIPVTDPPQHNPISVAIEKVDAETGAKKPQGKATLKGAEFTVKYYDVISSSDPVKAGEQPLKTWVLATDEKGEVKLADAYKIKGDAFYKDTKGNATMPLGTVTVQESKAPKGYKINNQMFTIPITADGVAETVHTYVVPKVKEEPIRGDLKGVKVSDGDMKRMANVPFKITSVTTKESHIVVTDANGMFDTSSAWNLHSQNTNQGKTAEDGVWFGDLAALDDKKGALPYDDYEIKELPCEANADKVLLEPFVVYVYKDMQNVNLGTLTNDYEPVPEIGTTAMDQESGGHHGFVSEVTTIEDVVEYINLKVGKEYLLKGILMDKASGKPLFVDGREVTAEKAFKPSKANGSVKMEFTFDSRLLQGKELVVFESLYLDKKEVATHTDITDEGQTVKYEEPKIGTTAVDRETGEHHGFVNQQTTIVDTVQYENLIVGKEYTVKGVLMDKESGKALLVNGKEVTAGKTFTAGEKSGSVEVSFTFDSSALAGKEIVVFESLYYQNRGIAVHADITDLGQTVEFEEPEIGTTAVDQETGGHQGHVSQQTTIIDTIQYENLIARKEYTVKGVLMDKESGKALLVNDKEVTAEKTFIAGKKSGSVEVSFTFDSSALAGKEIVVFENLYYQNREIAVHANITDLGQTVEFEEPEIGTTAVDQETGGHQGYVSQQTTIVDMVQYENLIVGKEYTVKGVLMDKESGKALLVNEKEVTAEKTFTAGEKSGSVEVSFTFDSSILVGKEVVVFESLYYQNREIAVHADIADLGQTVEFEEPGIGTTAVDQETGEHQGYVNQQTTIVDTVQYENLIIGKEYTVKGVLMDKESGKVLMVNGKEVTAEKTFTAGEKSGSVEVSFTFDSSALAGKEIVVFENLYYQGREIAVHADITDQKQTVGFKNPKIGTTATEKGTGKKEITPSKKVTVVDRIQYENLIVGKEYTVKGILMDKKTGKPLLIADKEVRAEKTFTASKESGSVEVIFTFDARELAGKELVVFEYLYFQEREITSHADIKDKAQTVQFVKVEAKVTNTATGKTTSAPKTGDTTQLAALLSIMAVSAVAVVLVYRSKRRKVKNKCK